MNILFAGMHLNMHAREFHSHDSWEIIYCTSGSGQFFAQNGNPIAYSANDIIIVPPHLEHSNVSDKTFSNYYLLIDNIDIFYDKVVFLHDRSGDFFLGVLKQIYQAYNSNLDNKKEILFHLGAITSCCLKSIDSVTQCSSTVSKLKRCIEDNLSDPDFDLNCHISQIHPSMEYLRKRFKKETDLTPLQYLTETRLNYAQALLKIKYDIQLNITEIANMSGFSDSLYFSRLYKKRFGKSPKYEGTV